MADRRRPKSSPYGFGRFAFIGESTEGVQRIAFGVAVWLSYVLRLTSYRFVRPSSLLRLTFHSFVQELIPDHRPLLRTGTEAPPLRSHVSPVGWLGGFLTSYVSHLTFWATFFPLASPLLPLWAAFFPLASCVSLLTASHVSLLPLLNHA